MQSPDSAKPAQHFLDPDVKQFVSNGSVKSTSRAYIPAFKAFSDTSFARDFDVTKSAGRQLLATADFARTVKTSTMYVSDAYQRSVQWMISRRSQNSNTLRTSWSRAVFLHPAVFFTFKHLHELETVANSSNPGYISPSQKSMGGAAVTSIDSNLRSCGLASLQAAMQPCPPVVRPP